MNEDCAFQIFPTYFSYSSAQLIWPWELFCQRKCDLSRQLRQQLLIVEANPESCIIMVHY